jgi:diketogulonate reductase-like aldo/keto reductase
MRNLTLRTGDAMPALGLGTWKIPAEVCAETVHAAIAAGYRHLDCACDYGNEVEVGQGVARAIDDGLVTREDLWITSKLWNTYHRPEHVEPAIRRTLGDLGVEYLDLYLIHFPISLRYVPFEERYPPEWLFDPDAEPARMEFDPVPIASTWAAMEALVPAGLTRNLGVCNMTTGFVSDLLASATIPPAVLQVEMHPYLTQQRLVRFAAQNDIAVTAFSPLGAGSYVGIGMATPSQSALEHPVVRAISGRIGATPAQVLLAWAMQRGTNPIVKSSAAARLVENLGAADVSLADHDMAAIDALNQNLRFNDPGQFCEAAFNTFCPIFD